MNALSCIRNLSLDQEQKDAIPDSSISGTLENEKIIPQEIDKNDNECIKGKNPPNGGGATAWSGGSFDPHSKVLYMPLGNPTPDYNASTRLTPNLYANHIVLKLTQRNAKEAGVVEFRHGNVADIHFPDINRYFRKRDRLDLCRSVGDFVTISDGNPTAITTNIDLETSTIRLQSIRNDLYVLTHDNRQTTTFTIDRFNFDKGLTTIRYLDGFFRNSPYADIYPWPGSCGINTMATIFSIP